MFLQSLDNFPQSDKSRQKHNNLFISNVKTSQALEEHANTQKILFTSLMKCVCVFMCVATSSLNNWKHVH